MPWPRELMQRRRRRRRGRRRGRGRRRTRTMFGETSRAPSTYEEFRDSVGCHNRPRHSETVGTSRGTRAYAIKLRMTEGISAGLFRLIVQTIVLFLGSGYWESSCLQVRGWAGEFLLSMRIGWFNAFLLFFFSSFEEKDVIRFPENSMESGRMWIYLSICLLRKQKFGFKRC